MRKFGIICLILGVLMILSAGVWMFYNEQEDERAGREARLALTELIAEMNGEEAAAQTDDGADIRTVTAVDATAAVLPGETAAPDTLIAETGDEADTQDGSTETGEMTGLTIDGHTYIGYVSVPEIGLALPVQRDYEFDLLDISPVRFRGSLQTGDLIVAGHNYKTHFSPLKNVSLGSSVIFTDVDGVEYDYIVSKIQTIAGSDYGGMMADSDEWDLTLFTCTRGGKNRLTLRCVETGRQTIKASK